MRRGQQHVLDRKIPEAVVLFEWVVKQAPMFDGGHYELAEAHRMQGLELALKGPSPQAAQRRHLRRRRRTIAASPIFAASITSWA
jgi:hypothetical protein